MNPAHRQQGYAVRLEWGMTGASAVADDAAYAVVVDVLSFTTAVTIAVERGGEVLPYPWRDAGAPAYAEQHGAVLARGRREALADHAPSLSPASLVSLPRGTRLVLPSPHGSAIAHRLAGAGATVVAASLRNAPAVAAWLAERSDQGAVALVPAGERWPDGSLRPAAEDLWGAGAVAAELAAHGVGEPSPEADLAAAAFAAVRSRLAAQLLRCASGRELDLAGFRGDVRLAAEHAVADTVPVLGEDGAFRAG